MKLPHSLRALESPNYRRYLLGQCISMVGSWMTAGVSLCGASFVGLSVGTLAPGLLCYAGAGLGTTIALVSANTWLHRLVEDDKRGRTMSLFGMGQGFYPNGSLALGAFTSASGPRIAIAASGLLLLLSGFSFGQAMYSNAG